MAAQPNHDVAHVGQPLLDVLVLRAGEQRRVFVEQPVQRRLRRLALVDDPAANLGREGRIVQDRLVGAKDGRLARARPGWRPFGTSACRSAAVRSRAWS